MRLEAPNVGKNEGRKLSHDDEDDVDDADGADDVVEAAAFLVAVVAVVIVVVVVVDDSAEVVAATVTCVDGGFSSVRVGFSFTGRISVG